MSPCLFDTNLQYLFDTRCRNTKEYRLKSLNNTADHSIGVAFEVQVYQASENKNFSRKCPKGLLDMIIILLK